MLIGVSLQLFPQNIFRSIENLGSYILDAAQKLVQELLQTVRYFSSSFNKNWNLLNKICISFLITNFMKNSFILAGHR